MIFLYHSVIPNNSPIERFCVGQGLMQSAFESQILWLAGRRHLVSLAEYLTRCQEPEFIKQKPAAITFDDGFRLTFDCTFPFLAENEIPVAIFVSMGHLEHGNLLWFSYLKALCFENVYSVLKFGRDTFPLQNLRQRKQTWRSLRALAKASGDPLTFSRELAKSYPLPENIFRLYEGMTHDQIRAASHSGLVELGAHTITHPYLNQIPKEKQKFEILESGRSLSEIAEKPVRYFAYPAGEYNLGTLNLVIDAGYEAAFAVIPKKLMAGSRFEMERVGIYSQSLLKFQMKTMGLASLARRFGMRVG